MGSYIDDSGSVRAYRKECLYAALAKARDRKRIAPVLLGSLEDGPVTYERFQALVQVATGEANLNTVNILISRLLCSGLLTKIKRRRYVFKWPVKPSIPKPKAVNPVVGKSPNPALSKGLQATPALVSEMTALNPRIWMGNSAWLLEHPDEYLANKEALRRLNAWFDSDRADSLSVSASDRAYEIWGDEKALGSSTHVTALDKLLGNIGITRDDLNIVIYGDHAFPYLINPDAPEGSKVILSENSCTYNALHQLLMTRPVVDMFGTSVHGAIFANGGGVFRKTVGDFSEGSYLKKMLHHLGINPADVLYLGDIDPMGIKLMEQVADVFGIESHYGAYEAMCSLHAARSAEGRPEQSFSSTQEWPVDIDAFYSSLSPTAATEARRAIEHNIRIPQEILTTPLMRSVMDRNDGVGFDTDRQQPVRGHSLLSQLFDIHLPGFIRLPFSDHEPDHTAYKHFADSRKEA